MSAQTSYNLRTSHGVAGGLYDLTDHDVDTRNNEAADGKVKFGLGLVEGTAPGKNVTLPVTTSTKAKFEGVAINSHAHEQDYKGDVTLRKGETVGVLTKGRIYVRITTDGTCIRRFAVSHYGRRKCRIFHERTRRRRYGYQTERLFP